MDQHRETYRQEAEELLGELEGALLELEETPEDLELVGRAFRAMHTIKGSGAMFGFDDVASFTHELESAFDRVRNGKLEVTRELVDVGLAAKDHIRALLVGSGRPETGSEVLDRLSALVGPGDGTAQQAGHPDAPPGQPGEGLATYRVRFRPGRDILATGTNPLLLLDELRALGQCQVVAQTEAIPLLGELDPGGCYTYWDAILTTDRGVDAIRDVFIFVEDHAEVLVEEIDGGRELDLDADYKKLGEILVERGDLTREDMERVVRMQRRFGEVLEDQKMVSPGKVDSALVEQRTVREARKERQTAEASASLRVPAEKLDNLVDLVGELVIAQARLSQTAAHRDDPELNAIAEDVERLTSELRDNALNIRMLPIGTTFGRFRRLVRDLSAELGKEVELITEGAETELDKTVIERLGDPLVHLIRNSIDHGLEPPEERTARNKPPRGTVRLSAAHSGANVVIEISDDGAGLDAEAIRVKAVERGLLAPEARPGDEELFDLVFSPGFSTAKSLSNVSGRGVGMDVVKRSIEALRGSVEIASRRGEGTRVTIRLPLTLAIIEGLLVGVGGERFVLPLAIVEECVELTGAEVEQAHGRRMTEVRDHLVPYVRLREWFGIDGERPQLEQVIISSVEEEKFGFVVDEVVGQHQTVIKSLGKAYQNVDGLSGATILGDGTVALILDAPKVVQSVTAEAG